MHSANPGSIARGSRRFQPNGRSIVGSGVNPYHAFMAETEEVLPEHVRANRESWDRFAHEYVEAGHQNWAASEISWGIWDVPETQLRLLPDDLAGQDIADLGCGTGYASAWLARRGARPVGIDNSPVQLATARRFQAEFGLEFPLHLGNAEKTPFENEQFDGAFSEYGAALWADPYAWVPRPTASSSPTAG